MIDNPIPRYWKTLSPGKRRLVAVAGIVAAFMLVFFIMPDPREAHPVGRGRQKAVVHKVFSDDDTRKLSLDSVNARNRALEEQMEKFRKEIEGLKKTKNPADGEEQAKITETLTRQIEQSKLENKALEDKLNKTDLALMKLSSRTAAPRSTVPVGAPKSAELWGGQSGQPAEGAAASPTVKMDLRTIEEEDPADDEAGDKAAQEKSRSRNAFFLPAGTMISGVLLTGMDAPSGKSASRNPFPALVRVKHEALLPNRFRADIRECFIIVGGSGDLASERAILRGETLSCVRKDKRIVEASLAAYVVGEDGKTGIRGRVVTKQGAMIANALLAGFLQGVGKSFDVTPVQVLQTNPGNTTQYQSNTATDAFTHAAVGGAGSAMEKIANFYVQMAQETFPVVEVDAGRRVDLIVTKGVSVKFMDPDDLQKKQAQDATQARALQSQGGGMFDGLSGSLNRNGVFGNSNAVGATSMSPLGANTAFGQ